MEKIRNLPLTNNIIKIIAILTMTLDHIGYAIHQFVFNSDLIMMGKIFRYIGRLSMPLFAFLIVEGLMHTKDKLNYFLRITIMATLIAISFVLVGHFSGYVILDNIFVTFMMAILTVILFENKNKIVKITAVLPFLYVTACFILEVFEKNDGAVIGYYNSFFPTAIRAQYNLMGYLLIIVPYFVLSHIKKTETKICEDNNIDKEAYFSSVAYKLKYNGIFAISIIASAFLFWVITYINPALDILEAGFQSYMVFAAIPVLLYNHKLRLKNKILSWAFYLYYPIHLAIIFGVMAILYL